jgi:FAD/FMN-containing dehydrogenase
MPAYKRHHQATNPETTIMTELLHQCSAILGPGGLLTGADVYSRQAAWNQGPCLAKAILRPRSTSQLCSTLKLCHAAGQAIVTQGGKTGKADGCLADHTEFVVSLERMRQVLDIDPTTRTITVQAGATLQQVQEAAASADSLFPLDLGARGSATIGGNIATNAGGNRVLRYGMMRNLVVGLEAILADGSVISSMDKMLKNNAGYDLKQLFIGSEGTLGIVTQAILKLSPATTSQNTALVACASLQQIRRLLTALEKQLKGQLSAFEVMWQNYFELVTNDDPPGLRSPLPRDYAFYALIEANGYEDEADRQMFEDVLAEALESELLADAVVARSIKDRDNLWAIRDNVRAYLAWHPVFSYDVSLGIADIEAYVDEVQDQIQHRWPASRIAIFGHLGDGNIHLAVAVGDGSDATHDAVNHCVYRILSRYHGSISAEHGIGLAKRDYLHYSRSPEEIALMHTLKRALDPRGILNPGKVLPPIR